MKIASGWNRSFSFISSLSKLVVRRKPDNLCTHVSTPSVQCGSDCAATFQQIYFVFILS